MDLLAKQLLKGVEGAASSVDGQIVVADGTTGKKIGFADKQTLSATSPITVSNTPAVIANAAPVIAIPAATNTVAGHATAVQIQALEAVVLAAHSNASDHTQGTDTALGAVGTKDPPIDADKAIYRDSTASDALVTSTWTQVKAFLKTYFDTLYNKYVHPNHSGEVTSVADGAQTIANDAVTYAKMQNVSATDKVLGRATAEAGDVEEIACTAAGRALIDDANAAAQIVTLGVLSIADTKNFALCVGTM